MTPHDYGNAISTGIERVSMFAALGFFSLSVFVGMGAIAYFAWRLWNGLGFCRS